MDIVAKVGIATNIAVRTYITVLADVNVSFNVYACPDNAALIQKQFTMNMGTIFHLAFDFCLKMANQLFINFNQFPWTADIDPVLIGLMSDDCLAVFNLHGY